MNPYWSKVCKFDCSGGKLLFIRLFDHERFKKKHDLIGSVEIDISEYFDPEYSHIKWVDVFYDHQLAAEVKLKFTF